MCSFLVPHTPGIQPKSKFVLFINKHEQVLFFIKLNSQFVVSQKKKKKKKSQFVSFTAYVSQAKNKIK